MIKLVLMKKTHQILIFISLIVSLVIWDQFRNSMLVTVTNFEECIAAGNPAMESYPRQCIHGDLHFVEDVTGDVPTSADNAPPGGIHNLPVPDAVATVRTHLAEYLGVNEGIVIIMSVYEKEWGNSCLGLANVGDICAQVITPGYEVTAQVQGNRYIYHTNSDGSALRRKE